MPDSSESRYIRLEVINGKNIRVPSKHMASYELSRMLGGGEVVGGLQMSWNELLDDGDEPF
ncbi:uncharacterized protein F5147DRAFT_758350, partial [Suillus discolor]